MIHITSLLGWGLGSEIQQNMLFDDSPRTICTAGPKTSDMISHSFSVLKDLDTPAPSLYEEVDPPFDGI